MAEGGDDSSTDQSQKTEEPTARRLEEARKRGQVIYSKEISNWAMLFTATLIIITAGPYVMRGLSETFVGFLARPHMIPTDPGGLGEALRNLILDTASYLLLPLAVLAFAGIMSGFVQTGPIFTAETMKPDISKLSPLKGFARLFSGRSIAEFVKGIAKLLIVTAAGFMAMLPYFDTIDHFIGQDVLSALLDMRGMFLSLMIAVLLVLFVIALMDYIYQRHEFMQKMRMSKQEIKDEFKQTEGDPMVKGRLRQLREQKARQRMIQAVPEADVVITNPTHYAVALKYDAKEMDAPVMVAKGADLVAQRIKEVARESKVPMIENPILARALFDSMEIDQVIPQEHYKAVAEVISYVFKLKGKKL